MTALAANLQSHQNSTVHFTVQATADPATLSRVVEYFALNNILPETVRCRHFVNGNLVIDIRVKGLDDQRVSILANKLRSCVLVYGVGVEVLAVGTYLDEYRATRAVA